MIVAIVGNRFYFLIFCYCVLAARSDADKSAQQSQALWAACQSLWSGVKNGVPGKSWKESLRPLQNEIKAVGKASGDDEEVWISGDEIITNEHSFPQRAMSL